MCVSLRSWLKPLPRGLVCSGGPFGRAFCMVWWSATSLCSRQCAASRYRSLDNVEGPPAGSVVILLTWIARSAASTRSRTRPPRCTTSEHSGCRGLVCSSPFQFVASLRVPFVLVGAARGGVQRRADLLAERICWQKETHATLGKCSSSSSRLA